MSKLGSEALAMLATARGGLFTASEAATAGVTRGTLRWAVESGVLVRLRQGAFTTAQRWEECTPEQQHLLRLRAALRLNPAAVAVAGSAAVLHGLPVPVLGRPQLASSAANGLRAGVIFGRLRTSQVHIRQGLRTTSPLVAVVDCALRFERAWGLAVADAAIFTRLVTAEALRDAVAVLPPQPGLHKARWVAEHAKPKVESPLESLARAAIVLAGLPEPEPQVWVQTRLGRFRVDMLDLPSRVVTEADGKLKYDGQTSVRNESVWKEKGRQDALRDFPLEVVRFTMADHHNHLPWLAAYRRALVRATRFG